jgi:hypothetical protein
VPAIDEHGLAHAALELFVGVVDLAPGIGFADLLPQRGSEGPFELVAEAVGAAEEQGRVLEKIEQLGGVQVAPQDGVRPQLVVDFRPDKISCFDGVKG